MNSCFWLGWVVHVRSWAWAILCYFNSSGDNYKLFILRIWRIFKVRTNCSSLLPSTCSLLRSTSSERIWLWTSIARLRIICSWTYSYLSWTRLLFRLQILLLFPVNHSYCRWFIFRKIICWSNKAIFFAFSLYTLFKNLLLNYRLRRDLSCLLWIQNIKVSIIVHVFRVSSWSWTPIKLLHPQPISLPWSGCKRLVPFWYFSLAIDEIRPLTYCILNNHRVFSACVNRIETGTNSRIALLDRELSWALTEGNLLKTDPVLSRF